MEPSLRKKSCVLTTPPKRNRGRSKTRSRGGTLVELSSVILRTAAGVHTPLSGETGIGRQNPRGHVPVALAHRLFVTCSLADLERVPRGKPFFLPPKLSAVLGRTLVHVVTKHSAVLCEV